MLLLLLLLLSWLKGQHTRLEAIMVLLRWHPGLNSLWLHPRSHPRRGKHHGHLWRRCSRT